MPTAGDADGMTIEHSVEMFRLLGGGVMGDAPGPLPASRLAILPASSHTAVISQPDLMMEFVRPFLAGEVPEGWSEGDEVGGGALRPAASCPYF